MRILARVPDGNRSQLTASPCAKVPVSIPVGPGRTPLTRASSLVQRTHNVDRGAGREADRPHPAGFARRRAWETGDIESRSHMIQV